MDLLPIHESPSGSRFNVRHTPPWMGPSAPVKIGVRMQTFVQADASWGALATGSFGHHGRRSRADGMARQAKRDGENRNQARGCTTTKCAGVRHLYEEGARDAPPLYMNLHSSLPTLAAGHRAPAGRVCDGPCSCRGRRSLAERACPTAARTRGEPLGRGGGARARRKRDRHR